MKTIRAIKKTKEVEIGEMKRVDDKTAHNMVGTMWEYVPKSEWKLATRKPKEVTDQVTDQPTDQVVKTRKKSKNEKDSKKA